MTLPGDRLVTACVLLAAALAFQLPAELIEPILRVGPIGITNVEATGYLLVVVWLVTIASGRLPVPPVSRWVIAMLVLLLIGALVTSWFALYDRPAALKAATRFGGALVVGLAVASIVLSQTSRWRTVAVTGLAGATLSAVLGIVEFTVGWERLGWFFDEFREAPISLGGFATRATGTLLHPNLAAWFWGVSSIGALSAAATTRGRARAILLVAGGVLVLAVVLALSRGGLIGVTAASFAAAVVLWRSGRARLRTVLLIVVMPLPAIALLASVLSPLVATRLVSETDIEWYRFRTDVPSSIESEAGTESVPVEVTNLGPIVWPAEGDGRVVVSYHVRGPDGEFEDYTGEMTELPESVEPGETVEVAADVVVAGGLAEALLEWDLLQVGGSWFSLRLPAELSETDVRIASPDEDAPPGGVDDAPTEEERQLLASMAFGRGELWAIAAELLAERPLLGIGFDNFRLGYGTERGLSEWDDSLTSHNILLEMTLSLGVFVIAVVALGIGALARLMRGAGAGPERPELFLFVVLVALAVHGMLDAFLLFSTAMYLTGTALMAGLTGRQAPRTEPVE